jgi:hypothetical protein
VNDALLSSEFQSFRTPPEFLEIVRRFAPIALDPATDFVSVFSPLGWCVRP